MGKNNKARRAAKAKKRSRAEAVGRAASQRTGSADDGGPVLTEGELIAGWWDLGSRLAQRGDQQGIADMVDRLVGARRALVELEAEGLILRMVALLWDNGWQPSELIRFVRRSTSAVGARLVEQAVLADHRLRAESTLDPAWAVQVEGLDPISTATNGWLADWAISGWMTPPEWIRPVMDVIAALNSCGPIEELIPPPGSTRRADAVIDLRSATDPVLQRVRALLAQAESTTFEAEAESFTAKAQQLMTRHAIDLAMVAETAERTGGSAGERPATIRVPIDDPYADMKSLMLQIVAEVSRCRAIFTPRYSFTTVIGFAHDLASTEMLFTSLLVQAQSALADAGRHAPPGARARSRAFKSSFLLGYANRVGDRLDEINRSVAEAAEKETTRSVLPALIARADVVDEEVDRRFSDLTVGASRRGHDPFGYHQGSAAADVAQLAFSNLAAGEGRR